jgi:hypothetical protein
VDTRLGTLKFYDGFPDDATVQKVYDNLDFQRGVQAFLVGLPGSSLSAMRTGLHSLGANNSTVVIFEQLLDSKSLWLTPNTDSIYFATWLDLHDGPLVVESPPNVLAFMDDFWFHYVTDLGNAGPDKGKGGKFLLLPPGYKGEVPSGYFVARSPTFGVWFAGVRSRSMVIQSLGQRTSRTICGSTLSRRLRTPRRRNSSTSPVSLIARFTPTTLNSTKS